MFEALHALASALKLLAAVRLNLIVEGSCQKPSSELVLELRKLRMGKLDMYALMVFMIDE